MVYSVGQLIWLFFIYSFAGWCTEVIVSTLSARSYLGRGFLAAPFCYVYGTAAILMTLSFQNLRSSPFLLYLSCTMLATGMQYALVHLLRRFGGRRWWDYSAKPVNLHGDLCLHYALFFGVPGLIAVDWLNDSLASLYSAMPSPVAVAAVLCLLFAAVTDIAGYRMERRGLPLRPRLLGHAYAGLKRGTLALGGALAGLLMKHMERNRRRSQLRGRGNREPEKLQYREVLWIFLIGSFLGCICETIFCRFALGTWMSRSSLVFGQLSVVWGLSVLLGTILLRKSRDRSIAYLFFVGTLGGLVFEYILSYMGEVAFGKVFWDYSGYSANIGGRVNLAFSFLWGLSAVLWIKVLYPPVRRFITFLLDRTGIWLSAAALVILALDLTVSYMALDRYKARNTGAVEASMIDGWLDRTFPDAVMSNIFPTAVDPEDTEINKIKRGEL